MPRLASISLVVLFVELFCAPINVSFAAITTIPTVPQAYESFRVEIETDYASIADPGILISIDMADNNITVVYSAIFLPPFGMPFGAQIVNLPGLPPGRYKITSREYGLGLVTPLYDPDGRHAGDPSVPPLPPDVIAEFDVAEAPPTLPVYARFRMVSEHYFLTVSVAERDQGGDGYLVVDEYSSPSDAGFKAWPADGPAPSAAKPVCRFYSSLVDSHFYTANEAECESLKQDAAWTYEGIAFRALVPTARACPLGTTEVWRLYNGRAAQGDTNHRFIANAGVYRAMVAAGWIGEGVAFCSPP